MDMKYLYFIFENVDALYNSIFSNTIFSITFSFDYKKGNSCGVLVSYLDFFSVTYGLFPVVFTKTFPIFYALNIVSDVMMKETTILIYLASSSIYILGIMLLAVSFKYYTYE